MRSSQTCLADQGEDNYHRKASTSTHIEQQSVSIAASDDEYETTTFDGYQTIQNANSRYSRSEELEVMKKSRNMNRVDSSNIDEAVIGVKKGEEDKAAKDEESILSTDQSLSLKDMYSQIEENKRIFNKGIELNSESLSGEDLPARPRISYISC